MHVGDGEGGLAPIRDALSTSDLPITSFLPTHVNRNQALLDEAIEFAKEGGCIDITVSSVPEFIEQGEVPALQALESIIAAGVPDGNYSLSSDAGGSLPLYRDGKLQGLQAAGPGVLLELLCDVLSGQPETAAATIASMTRNPARALGLETKGRIEPDCDANFLILNQATHALTDVFCRGRRLMRRGAIE